MDIEKKEEIITIKIDKEKANMFYSILLAAATQLNEFDEEGFLPIEKLPMLEFIEDLRQQVIDYCKKEKMDKKSHLRFIKYQLSKIGEIKNDRMDNKHEI